jgi:hypothetical protein
VVRASSALVGVAAAAAALAALALPTADSRAGPSSRARPDGATVTTAAELDVGAPGRWGGPGRPPGAGGAGPDCPAPGRLAPASVDDANAARAAASRFATAIFLNDRDVAFALSDLAFRGDVIGLTEGMPRTGRPFIADEVLALGHSELGAFLARRCGVRVVPSFRVVRVHLPGTTLGATLLLVRRYEGWRVIGLR